jgi:hypothetical protein
MERNEEKIKKQRNSLLWNPHKIGKLLAFAAVIWLVWACGGSILTAVAIYLGYKVLRLVLRLIGQLLSVLFTVVSIVVLIIIISLIIF